MFSELPTRARALSRLVAIAICGALSTGIGTADAAKLKDQAAVQNRSSCPTCFNDEAETTPPAAERKDPLDLTLCRSAMSSSPPLTPICGRYR